MTRSVLVALLVAPLAGAACTPPAERADLLGLWGRVEDREHEVWELAESIDATGLTDVRPAFRMYRYPIEETVALEVKRGRWDVLSGDMVITPTWSLTEGEANRTLVWEVDYFDERELHLLPPGAEEPVVYVTLSQLPVASPE